MLWNITYRETVVTPLRTLQVVHIERDDGCVLVLERLALEDEMTKADMAALAFADCGEIIDPNNID
jgi:hypothetical protein